MIFLYGLWTRLPIESRNILAGIFGIKKTGATHVVADKIQSDGYSIDDIEASITMETMQKYTGSDDEDMKALWDLTVSMAIKKKI